MDLADRCHATKNAARRPRIPWSVAAEQERNNDRQPDDSGRESDDRERAVHYS
jgi:hypothetical protein